MNEMTKARIKIAIAAFVFLYCSFKLLQTVYTWTWTPVEAVVLDVDNNNANNGVKYAYSIGQQTYTSNNVNLFGWMHGNKFWDPHMRYAEDKTVTSYVDPINNSTAVLERSLPLLGLIGFFVSTTFLFNHRNDLLGTLSKIKQTFVFNLNLHGQA